MCKVIELKYKGVLVTKSITWDAGGTLVQRAIPRRDQSVGRYWVGYIPR